MSEETEVATVPLAVMEAQEARDHRVVVALGIGWAVSVATMLVVMAWLTFAG